MTLSNRKFLAAIKRIIEFFFVLPKNRLTKWMFYIFPVLLGIIAVSLIIGLDMLEKRHEEEIRNVIQSRGGEVLKIEKVDPKLSPFADDFNKRSKVVYKIAYAKMGADYTAWYRGVNVVNDIHAENPTSLMGGFGEKWIIPDTKVSL